MEINSRLLNQIMSTLANAKLTIEQQRKEIQRLRITSEAYDVLAAAVKLGDRRYDNGVEQGYGVDLAWTIDNLMCEIQPDIDAENMAEKQAAYAEEKQRFDVRYADHERSTLGGAGFRDFGAVAKGVVAEAEGALQNHTDGAADIATGSDAIGMEYMGLAPTPTPGDPLPFPVD